MMNKVRLDDRHSEFKKRLLEITKSHHDLYISQEESKNANDDNLEYFKDSFTVKMWHHKFDPHSVPDVEPADLKPQLAKTGSYQRSESVKDFIDRNKLENLIQQKKPTGQIRSPTIARVVLIQKSEEDTQILASMSAKTGISVETLRLIKQKSDALKQAKDTLKDNMKQEDGVKR